MNINARLIQQTGNRLRRVRVIGGLLGVLAVVAPYADRVCPRAEVPRAHRASGRLVEGSLRCLSSAAAVCTSITREPKGFSTHRHRTFNPIIFAIRRLVRRGVEAMMTFGPQLSIGLIQGANQVGSPTVLPGPPRETAPLPPIESGFLDEMP